MFDPDCRRRHKIIALAGLPERTHVVASCWLSGAGSPVTRPVLAGRRRPYPRPRGGADRRPVSMRGQLTGTPTDTTLLQFGSEAHKTRRDLRRWQLHRRRRMADAEHWDLPDNLAWRGHLQDQRGRHQSDRSEDVRGLM